MGDHRHFDAEEPSVTADWTGIGEFLLAFVAFLILFDWLDVIQGNTISMELWKFWTFDPTGVAARMFDLGRENAFSVAWYPASAFVALAVYDNLYRKRWLGKLGKFLAFFCVIVPGLMLVVFLAWAVGIPLNNDSAWWYSVVTALEADEVEVNWFRVIVIGVACFAAAYYWLNMAEAQDGISDRQAKRAAKEAQETDGAE